MENLENIEPKEVATIEIELPKEALLFLEWIEGPENIKAFCEKAVLAILNNHIDCLRKGGAITAKVERLKKELEKRDLSFRVEVEE